MNFQNNDNEIRQNQHQMIAMAPEGGVAGSMISQHQNRNHHLSRSIPPWIQAENITCLEQSELSMLKCFTYVPVVITFSVFIFIFVFYSAVSDWKKFWCGTWVMLGALLRIMIGS